MATATVNPVNPELAHLTQTAVVASDDIVTAQQRVKDLYDAYLAAVYTLHTLQARRSYLANLAVPINRTPTELLAYIFTLVEEDSRDASRRRSISAADTITCVCRRWRDVAIATPSLWAHVAIDVPEHPRTLHQAETWLSRTSLYPVNIRVHLACVKNSQIPNLVEQASTVAAIIAPHMAHCRSLSIDYTQHESLSAILKRLSDKNGTAAPHRLETLSLVCNTQTRGPNALPPLTPPTDTLFSDQPLPSLRHLRLSDVHIAWPPHLMHNLLSLEIAYVAEARARWDMVIPSPQSLLTTLQSCPNLEKLICTGAAGEMWTNSPPFTHPIYMNNLRTLEFSGTQTPLGLSKIVPFLIAPNLRHLHLEMRTVDDDRLDAGYACPPLSSTEGVRSLSLKGWFPLRVVLAMLPNMKNVEELLLEGNPWTGAILESIAERGYMPRLKDVALERADQFGGALVRLAEVRSPSHHQSTSSPLLQSGSSLSTEAGEELGGDVVESLRRVHILYKASDGYPDVDRRRLEGNIEKVIIERTWS